MKILIAFIITFTSLISRSDSVDCLLSAAQLAEYLKLDYKGFDQTLPNGGWRGLDNKGCSLEATKLVEIYHLHHLGALEDWQNRILYWHAGQVYAMLGQSELALARFKKSYNPNEKPDGSINWNGYVDGSIAFLEHDLNKLLKARDKLRVASDGQPDANFKFLDAFVRCFKKPYKEAYNPSCK